MRAHSLTLAVLISSLSVFQSHAQVKVGPEFQIPGGYQAAIAGLKGGGLVVTSTIGDGIVGQRFDAAMAPAGSEFLVSHPRGHQSFSSVAGLSDGDFIAVWTSNSNNEDGSGSGVYGQRFNAAGAAIGNQFRINSYTSGNQYAPSIAGLRGDGGFVVVWTSTGQDGSGLGVFGQLYDANGKAVRREFRVNSNTAGDQSEPAVAALGGGGFVVTWTSANQDGSLLGVYGQRYTADRTQIGQEFRVNTATNGSQSNSAVAGLSNGFVVTWESTTGDGSNKGIYGQRYHASGTPYGKQFQVNTYTFSEQFNSSVAGLKDGGFIASWVSFHQNDNLRGVYAQRYNAAGTPVAAEFPVSKDKNNLYDPLVVGLPDGGFVITWTSSHKRNGPPNGLYGQRFTQ